MQNDANLQTTSPVVQYALGMDVLLKKRSLNHLKKLHARKEPMSRGFQAMVAGWVSTLSDSEGEWVAPPSDLSLLGLSSRVDLESDSGAEADTEQSEEAVSKKAKSYLKRSRGVGTRWAGKMRQH